MTDGRVRILFVCLGNICRSPTAEGIMRRLLEEEGLAHAVEVASAGTGSWHLGSPPDRRARAEAARRGLRLEGAAAQVTAGDFARYDLVVAMDDSNARHLREIAPTREAADQVRILRAFDPTTPHGPDVPDPYHGGAEGFADVFDLVEAACRGLLGQMREDGLVPT